MASASRSKADRVSGAIRELPARHGVASVHRNAGAETMPAKSKAQQMAAGAALSAKRGETKKSELKGASREMYDSMSEKQLEEFAETKRKGKPEHVSKKS
jgi:hypothetical protein